MFALPLLCLLTVAALGQVPAGLIRNGGFEEGPGTPSFLNLRGGSTALVTASEVAASRRSDVPQDDLAR